MDTAMNNMVYDQMADQFELPSSTDARSKVDLCAFTHGPMPVSVRDNLRVFCDDWANLGVDAWNEMGDEGKRIFAVGDEGQGELSRNFGWWTLPDVIGDRFIARLLNAPAGTCIMMPNATTVMSMLLGCSELNVPGKRKFVSTDGEFSAVAKPLDAFNAQFGKHEDATKEAVGLEQVVVEIGEGGFDADKIIAEIDDETALVVISHVGFLSGERVRNEDIKRIVEKAHKYGALVALDGYHAIGSEEIDVMDLGVDIYFGGLLKEGCGSSGNGFLYVRPDLDLHPSTGGWFGDKDPFAFKPNYSPDPKVVRRFLSGTTNVASFYHAVEGLKAMFRVGMDQVVADIRAKVLYVIETLSDAGITVLSSRDQERMSAMVAVQIDEADKFREKLKNGGQETEFAVDARKNSVIRLAPFITNSAEEIQAAVTAMIKTYQDGTYRDLTLEQSGGPVT